MKYYNKQFLGAILLLSSFSLGATICPDPLTSSLRWGVVPEPWLENPYSANSPQGSEDTTFVRANILVAGLGRGVLCTYKMPIGYYSIWWPVLTKIPARTDYRWIETLGGFVCTQALEDCVFHVA